MNKIRSRRGPLGTPIRDKLEAILLSFDIVRAAYHGGDLTGGDIIEFFNNVVEIFEQFHEVIKNSDKPDRCDNDKIEHRCKKTKELCSLLDYMFSLARTECGKINDEIIETTIDCVNKIEVKWNDLRLSLLGTKIHAIFGHLVPMMQKWEGIGCFGEDFVEKGHQVGKREESRTANMVDRVKAAISHSRNEHATMVPEIEKMRKQVKLQTSRKRKKDVSNNSIETKKKERTKRRKECLENATMEADPVESILLLGEDSDDDDDNDDIYVNNY